MDLSFLTDSKWRKIERLELEVLCTIFRKLARHAPSESAILCVIDEISLYETQMLQPRTNLVMEKLVRLATKQGDEQQAVKLLVTCQDRALGVSRYVSGHTIDLQEDIEAVDSAGWAMSAMA